MRTRKRAIFILARARKVLSLTVNEYRGAVLDGAGMMIVPPVGVARSLRLVIAFLA